MPAYTYQIAMRNNTKWLRAYVCAEDKEAAVCQFIEENPPLTMDALFRSDELQIERCDG